MVTVKACVSPLHPWDYCSMMVVVDQRIRLLVAFLLWKLTWYLLVSYKLVLKKEAFMSVLAERPLGPLSEIHGVFSNKILYFKETRTIGTMGS